MRLAIAALSMLFVSGCSPSLPPLFEQQNACFAEVGLPPIEGFEGGHYMTEEQASVYTACMERAGYGGQGNA